MSGHSTWLISAFTGLLVGPFVMLWPYQTVPLFGVMIVSTLVVQHRLLALGGVLTGSGFGGVALLWWQDAQCGRNCWMQDQTVFWAMAAGVVLSGVAATVLGTLRRRVEQ